MTLAVNLKEVAPENFRTISLFTIGPDEPLPFRLAIFYKGRHIVYRMPGQIFESRFYNKFVYKKIHRIFVPETDFPAYMEYCKKREEEEAKAISDPNISADQREVNKMLQGMKSAATQLFAIENPDDLDEGVQEAFKMAQLAVETVVSKPYMQIYNSLSYKANSIADHSMRVSVLATFLGYQLGFVNPMALEHLAAAAMLHDIGKTKLDLSEDFVEDGKEDAAADEEILKMHPTVSCDMLSRMAFVPQEVVRIIREHHEMRDGSGYPAGIRGPKMYGLSKVFTIANTFDNLSSEGDGDRAERYLKAAKVMLTDLRPRFDANLLPKAIRLLTHTMKLE